MSALVKFYIQTVVFLILPYYVCNSNIKKHSMVEAEFKCSSQVKYLLKINANFF